MAARKKAKKMRKAAAGSGKRNAKKGVKDLSPRGKARSVKGGLLPAVKPAATTAWKWNVASPTLNPGAPAMGDGSV